MSDDKDWRSEAEKRIADAEKDGQKVIRLGK